MPSLAEILAVQEEFSPAGGEPMPVSNDGQRAAAAQNRAAALSAIEDLSTPTNAPAATRSPLSTPMRQLPTAERPGIPWDGGNIDNTAQVASLDDWSRRFDQVGKAAPVVAGLGRGVRDVVDTVKHAAGDLAGKMQFDGPEAGGATGTYAPDMAAVREADKAARDEYDKRHGGSTWAGLGRVGGQIAATLPAIAALPVMAPAAGFARVAQLAGEGAVTGGLQAALTSSSSDASLPSQIGTGAAIGSVAGPVLGGVTQAIDTLRGLGGGVRPEVAKMAQRLRDIYKVNIPATSMSTNPTVRMVADQWAKLPFSGADAAALASQRQMQGAIAREMGSTSNRFDDAAMGETAARLHAGYETLFRNAPPVAGGKPLVDAVAKAQADASRVLVGDQLVHVGNAAREVRDAFRGSNSGSLNPEAYKSLMGANDGILAEIEDAAPSTAQPYLAQIRKAVEDRFAASAGPEAADTLRQLDRQYRAMKTVEPLAGKSQWGDIQVGGLKQQTINQSRRFDGSTSGIAYTGGGPLGELGKAGSQFFGHIPDSGTAARLQGGFGGVGAVGTTATVAMPNRLLQLYLRSRYLANNLIDSSLGGAVPSTSRAIPYGLLGPIDLTRP